MNEKPIVLLVSGEYPPYSAWGGNAYQFQHMAHLLNREGFDVEVIAETDNGEEFMHLDDVGNVVHRVTGARSYLFKAFQKAFPRIGRKLTFGNLAFSMRCLEKALELRHFWGRRILWVESTNWRAETLFFHWIPWLNERTIVRIVTPFEEVVRQNAVDRGQLGVKVHLFSEWLQQMLLKHRFYSNDDYKTFFEARVKTSFRGFPRGAERTFLLPFDFDRVKGRPARSHPVPEVIKLLMVGRIETRKGFDTVGSALSALSADQRRRIRVQAIGRDTDLGPFKSYKRMLQERFPGIYEENFEWLGVVPDGKLQEAFANADVGLMASTSESFGYNTLELLSSDLPVIASEVGATNEFERRGVRYLGKFRSAAELSKIFAELPERLEAYQRSNPNNRTTLMEVYAENDRKYLEYVRGQVASKVAEMGNNLPRRRYGPVQSVDVICATERFDALMVSLPAVVRQVETAKAEGITARVWFVHHDVALSDRIRAWRSDLMTHPLVRFVGSAKPGVQAARNAGVAASDGDLVVFVGDDAVPEAGFLMEHVTAANAHLSAVGVAGRYVFNNLSGRDTRMVGQIRPSGVVETNFDSIERGSPLVAAAVSNRNLSLRRLPLTALFGDAWFDERLPSKTDGTELLLGTELFRRGEHIVYCPNASVCSFSLLNGAQAVEPEREPSAERYLWLGLLYEAFPLLQPFAVALQLRRDLKGLRGERGWLKRLAKGLSSYWNGRQLVAKERPVHPQTLDGSSQLRARAS